jgi:hypothetical protein
MMRKGVSGFEFQVSAKPDSYGLAKVSRSGFAET